MKKIPEKDPYRVAIAAKIEEFERTGRFDEDVEEDPPTKPLLPEDIEYLDKSLGYRCRSAAAFAGAHIFFRTLQLKRDLVLKPTVGLEHLKSVPGGAIITCNHFHPMDSFIMQLVFDASHHKGKLYRVIREGNYTSFPGFYGFLMRNCNTLPLSANLNTMKKFLKATRQVLEDGHCLLIYPEQSMWWHYRKPKPLKPGAFDMAVKNNVPVIPCFITMVDNRKIGSDGFPVQEYTPRLGAPIYPDQTLPKAAARDQLRRQVESYCRGTYEQVYGIPLTYTTEL